MTNIVNRLRNRQAKWDNAVSGWIKYTLDDHELDEEIADEIEHLKGQLEGDAESIKFLNTENKRLRAALSNIIAGHGGECGCAETARYALERDHSPKI